MTRSHHGSIIALQLVVLLVTCLSPAAGQGGGAPSDDAAPGSAARSAEVRSGGPSAAAPDAGIATPSASEAAANPPERTPPAWEIRRLGVPVKAVTYVNSYGVLAPSPSGAPGMFLIGYYRSGGSALAGYCAATGERLLLPIGSDGGYGCCVGPDGAVYLGGVEPGNLYRYDPATKSVASVGGAELGVRYIWSCAAGNGKVYGGCYPGCNVIEYDPAKNSMRDLGRLVPNEDYVRPVWVDHRGKVWAGTGNQAHLFVIDPVTGERHDVMPPEYQKESTCFRLQQTGRFMLATVIFGGELLVFDVDSEKVVRVVPRPPAAEWWYPALGGSDGIAYLYASPTYDLYRLDAATGELQLLVPSLGQCEQVVEDRWVHGLNDQDYFVYDLVTKAFTTRQRLVDGGDSGMAICTLTAAADGTIFGTSFINQHIFRCDPASGELTDLGKAIRAGGQIDSIHGGRDGKVYLGAYAGAMLAVYDPAGPWRPGIAADSNPRELGRVGHGQIRTRAIALGPDRRIWVGSVPSYKSAPTGALTCWDPATGEHQSWLDLTPDGAVLHIATDERRMFCAGATAVFAWDPFEKRKLREREMRADALAVTQHGRLAVGSGDDVVLLDPETLEPEARIGAKVGAVKALAAAPGGLLYALGAAGIAEIEPGQQSARVVSQETGGYLAVDGSGRIYIARGDVMYRVVPGT